MASKATKAPILRAISKRSYASAALLAQACADVHVKVLPSKIVVAAAESAIPISRVSVLFRAGSKYETPENLGASSLIRSSAALSTSGATGFGIVRNLQQIGASLVVTSDRETISYTLEATSDHIEQGLKYLADAATKQVFKPWELEDQVPRLKYELATLSPQAKLFDLLNAAAYRTGLGNSLFVKDYNIGKLSGETLQYYVREHFTAPRSAVVGVGVTADHLSHFAESLGLENNPGSDVPAKYYGGEVRHDDPSSLVHVAIAAESSGLKSKDALVFSVLRYALGTGNVVPYGVGSGPLGKASASSKEALGLTAFNSAYVDSGLFGIALTTTAHNAKAGVEAAVKVLQSGSVSDVDVARGKALLKAALLQSYESGAGVVEDIGNQAVLLGTVLAAPQIAAAVDSITTAQVQDAAKKIASGKKSMAVTGKTSYTPYLDQVAK